MQSESDLRYLETQDLLPAHLSLQCVQNQVYCHWSCIMAAKKCDYQELKLRQLKNGILAKVVRLVVFSRRMFTKAC